jgi:hypothetical protein
MRAFVIVVLTVLPLVGCSHGPTQPTTSAAVSPPSPPLPAGTTIWRAESTIISVSATLNSCPTDNAVGQTRTVEWGVIEAPTTALPWLAPPSILLFESAGVFDPQHWPDYMSDIRTPVYHGSRTGDQFTAVADQDGMPSCFVWHGDLTGSFSPDGRTFDAVENIKYVHFGEDEMVVRRHWTGTNSR